MDPSKSYRMEPTDRRALIYDEEVDIRFSDLDPYGHVNSKHYIDYVLASRWLYLARTVRFTIGDCLERGLGFFLIRSDISYHKPIVSQDRVRVQSYVSHLKKIRLTVTFEIVDCSDETFVYSSGTLEFAIMDTKTKRPQLCPEWAVDLFSHPV